MNKRLEMNRLACVLLTWFCIAMFCGAVLLEESEVRAWRMYVAGVIAGE